MRRTKQEITQLHGASEQVMSETLIQSTIIMSLSLSFSPLLHLSSSPKFQAEKSNSRCLSFFIVCQGTSKPKRDGGSHRQVWRRRKLTKKDPYLEAKLERVPFLEEQMRKTNEGGGLISGDIDRLMKSEENRFAFVNEIAAEATAYVNNNRDEYGTKKAILHVLSNRMNDAGFYRPEAYLETDPFTPGPDYIKEEYT